MDLCGRGLPYIAHTVVHAAVPRIVHGPEDKHAHRRADGCDTCACGNVSAVEGERQEGGEEKHHAPE
jgi:hypothetical protein